MMICSNFSDELLENHKRSITEMIKRDKNRPSVVMWSAANEPRTGQESASEYYKYNCSLYLKTFLFNHLFVDMLSPM